MDKETVIIRRDTLRAVTCGICNDFYKAPHIITGCFCTFCYQCLHDRMKNGLSSCPSCGIAFDLFASGQTLPDHQLQAIVDNVKPHFIASSSDEK